MNAGNRIFLGLAAVTVLAAAGCQTSNEGTVTWQEDGVPYFQYEDSARDHYRFTYHPNDQVYYQPYTQQYYWYEDGTWWQGTRDELPHQLTLEGKVTFVDVPSRFPFKNHDSVLAMHPPRRPTPVGFDGRETVLMTVEATTDENDAAFVDVVDHPMLMDEASPAGETFVFDPAGDYSDDDYDAYDAGDETMIAHDANDSNDSFDNTARFDPDGEPSMSDEFMTDGFADEYMTDEDTDAGNSSASANWSEEFGGQVLFDDFWIWFPEHMYQQLQRLHQPDGTVVPTAPTVGAVGSTEMFPFTPADPAEKRMISFEESAYSPDGSLTPITPLEPQDDVQVVGAGSEEPSDD